MGRRARAVLKGDLGPVLKRWVSSSIVPVSARLRGGLERREDFGVLLGSPVFGLPEVLGHSPDLEVVLQWFLKPGIGDDLTLAVLGTAISACATADKPIPLTRLLGACAQAARETALGQFITQVQGAKAMMRVRKGGKAAWAQGKQMNAVALLLGSQVKDALNSGLVVDSDGDEVEVGGKAVLSIVTQKGDQRQITLRRPSEGDFALLDVARRMKGERDEHLGTWMSFAMLVICAAQAEAGWFDLTKVPNKYRTSVGAQRPAKRARSAAHGVVLSDAAHGAIKGDLDKWLGMGFVAEPMVVPPVNGDYLTVKHREVAGGRGPMGNRTRAQDSAAWHVAGEVMAGTEWSVNEHMLKALRESAFVQELTAKSEPDVVRYNSILSGYRKASVGPVYFPIYMDFRGRVYLRPSLVTYQGGDLQKSLLCFPQAPVGGLNYTNPVAAAVVNHTASLYGGPEKLDKAPFGARRDWYNMDYGHARNAAQRGDWDAWELTDCLSKADKPLQLLACMLLDNPLDRDRIAIQLDGTCNGLQHLTALFRDDKAAPYVNLTASTMGLPPCDIYGAVAERVTQRLRESDEPWAARVRTAVHVDRKLCKKPVMVLPYGGTRGTIEDAVHEAILGQEPNADLWVEGYDRDTGEQRRYADWLDGNYAAYRDRDLANHPLLALDAKRLGGLVWTEIGALLPKAMVAMQTFRDIAKVVGDRTLEWDTGFSLGDEHGWSAKGRATYTPSRDSLWVTQAKAKADRSTLKFKGFHLPGSVRGLSMRAGRDEVDPAAHTLGIVANFIHSQDAAHLAATMATFRRLGGTSFGANHDCLFVRPSEVQIAGVAVRSAFAERYSRDPLSFPVYLQMVDAGGRKLKDGVGTISFGSWYALADYCSTVSGGKDIRFPEDGTWDPAEVMQSAWFFS